MASFSASDYGGHRNGRLGLEHVRQQNPALRNQLLVPDHWHLMIPAGERSGLTSRRQGRPRIRGSLISCATFLIRFGIATAAGEALVCAARASARLSTPISIWGSRARRTQQNDFVASHPASSPKRRANRRPRRPPCLEAASMKGANRMLCQHLNSLTEVPLQCRDQHVSLLR